MVGRPKGLPKTGGRQPGTVNKLTANVKDMIVNALDELGGMEYLKTQGASNPTAFMTLVGKVLPLTLAGDKDQPLNVNATLTLSDKEIIDRYQKDKK